MNATPSTTTYIIPQKQSNSGSIHDLNSDMCDRLIAVPASASHIVILAAYYGGRGYTTHASAEAAAKKCRSLKKDGYSYQSFDAAAGKHLDFDGQDFQVGQSEMDLRPAGRPVGLCKGEFEVPADFNEPIYR